MVKWLIRRYIVSMFVMYRSRVHVECQCNFPSSLRGSWNGADRGIMTFENSSFLTSYTSANTDTLPATLDFNCSEKQENMFLLKATYEQTAFGGAQVKFYLCIEIHVVDDNIAYYYQLTEYSPFVKDNIFGYVPDNVTMSDICARDITPQNFIVMVKDGAVAGGIVDVRCPTAIQAIFTNMTTQRYGETDKYYCSGTVFDVCTDKTMINITYSEHCDHDDAKTLSSNGMYRCIHGITDGETTFLAVWNNDVGVSNPFSCFALHRVNDSVLATESPRYCSNTSTSTTAEPGGFKLILTDITKTCEEIHLSTAAQSAKLDGLWGLMGLPVALLVIIVASVLIYRKKMALKRRNNLDFFGSGPIHVDIASKPTFDPNVIHRAKMYNFRPKKPLGTFTPIWDAKWKSKQTLRMTPEPKVAPLYSDVIDDL